MSRRFRRTENLVSGGYPVRFGAVLGSARLAPQTAGEYALPLPSDVIPPAIPDDNPLTAAKVALGQKLYFDARLSADNTVSCATCHDPAKGFADGKPLAVGIGGKTGARNSPTVLNAAFNDFQFWDGRASTLEEQAKGPLTNPVEMGMASHDALAGKLQNISEYPPLFKQAFGSDRITIDNVARAIASYERTVFSFSSPFDRFNAGEKTAMSESAQRGWELFNGKARCNNCHGYVASSPTFTDNKFHNIGVAMHAANFAETVAQGCAITRVHFGSGPFPGLQRARTLPGDQGTERYRRVQDSRPARCCPHRPLHARWAASARSKRSSSSTTRAARTIPTWTAESVRSNYRAQEQADLVEFLKALTSDDLTRFSKPNSQP